MQNLRGNICDGDLLKFRCRPANLRKRVPVWSCAFPNFSKTVFFENASERLLLNRKSYIKLLVLRLRHHLPPADFKRDIFKIVEVSEGDFSEI